MFELISQSEPLELHCWVPSRDNLPVGLVFQLEQHEVRNQYETDIVTRLTVTSGAKSYEMSFGTHRDQLREFATAIQQIAVSKVPNIKLLNDSYGETVLCFTVRDREMGRVVFGGRLILDRFGTRAVSAEKFVVPPKSGHDASGVHLTFDGFETDQTYLHQLGTSILWFLNQSIRS